MYDLLLGIVQGITEFLPISSSGHLILINSFFQDANIDISMLTLLHLGTLGSILFYYRSEVSIILFHPLKERAMLGKILIGVLPAGLIGLFTNLSKIISNSVNILLYTGAAYIVLSIALYLSKNITEGEKGILQITSVDAFYIGIAQATALIPGISRAGVTLIAALLIGMKKKDALLFSFLLGIPTIGGAWILSLINHGANYKFISIIATLLAFFFGLLAIKILVKFTLESDLHKFSFYTLVLGFLLIYIN